MSEDQHVYPNWGPEHETEGRSCWCAPTVRSLCPLCDGDPLCGECGGTGLVLEYDRTALAVVTHRAPEAVRRFG